ncbi:hypothetical protein CAXC1_180064 [Candidatus Xenohaliotis californiensis]|uniref:Uncharacterized protein n=1 Tax=Candidatus Xenohaliotis californiensis TaxID=84677 RepID=A0ABM9N7J3_9RICK|nr:hypothetical protein CAXC1_180064 [Candidatus Xenohaliotis californiensis]
MFNILEVGEIRLDRFLYSNIQQNSLIFTYKLDINCLCISHNMNQRIFMV